MIERIALHSKKWPGLFAYVDSRFYEELSKHCWRVHTRLGEPAYAYRHVTIAGKQKCIFLHREVLRLAGVEIPAGMLTDHVDGNGFNNCRYNLRVATRGQNAQNATRVGSSQYLGVHWHKGAGKWEAKIRPGGKQKYLGLFDNEIDAALAYDAAARVAFGPYAAVNFSDSKTHISDYGDAILLVKRPLTQAGVDQMIDAMGLGKLDLAV